MPACLLLKITSNIVREPQHDDEDDDDDDDSDWV